MSASLTGDMNRKTYTTGSGVLGRRTARNWQAASALLGYALTRSLDGGQFYITAGI